MQLPYNGTYYTQTKKRRWFIKQWTDPQDILNEKGIKNVTFCIKRDRRVCVCTHAHMCTNTYAYTCLWWCV